MEREKVGIPRVKTRSRALNEYPRSAHSSRALPNETTMSISAKTSRTGLLYVSDADPGFRRRRAGNGFCYLDTRGRVIRDAATLDRIRALAIPPAYRDVWICTRGNGHLQATGRDARGRKQYRYHPRWNAMRGAAKFARIEAFGRALPKLRRALHRDVGLAGFPKRKVVAIIVSIMTRTYLRIGNSDYMRQNHSFGLTTLRNSHVRIIAGKRAKLSFRGKGGVAQTGMIEDKHLVALVRRCQQLPGQRLFQYRDDGNALHPIGSTDVNDYLRDAMDGEFTAKDFRTWGGTLTAMRLLAQYRPKGKRIGEAEFSRIRKIVENGVADQLNNTPAVCRSSYIDPRVYQAWKSGWLVDAAAGARGPRQWEALLTRLLKRHRA